MLSLRTAAAEDAEFLYEVYAGTRRREVEAFGWPSNEQEAFLRMQFEMQKQSYRLQYPDGLHRIILWGPKAVGRLLTAETAECQRLVDISLLSEYQNRGWGTQLIRQLQLEADEKGKPLRLHALAESPVVRLYRRLGFRSTEERFPYVAFEYGKACSGT